MLIHILADKGGNVNTSNGLFDYGQFRDLLQTWQTARPESETKIGYFPVQAEYHEKIRKIIDSRRRKLPQGYSENDKLECEIIDDMFKRSVIAAEKGDTSTRINMDMVTLRPYSTSDEEACYLISASEYYQDNLKRLGIEHKVILK